MSDQNEMLAHKIDEFPQSSAKISHSSSGRGEREGAGLTPRQTGYICDLSEKSSLL